MSPNLKLTKNQKEFAVDEAMNKIGTTRWIAEQINFSQKLDNEENKKNDEYIKYILKTLEGSDAHGYGEYDIRYYILKNRNWTKEEKQNLVFDFWTDDNAFESYLDLWEWGIINNKNNFKGNITSLLDINYLYDYTYEQLSKFYNNIAITNEVWEEIQFCKMIRELRPKLYSSNNKNLIKE